MRLTRVTTVPPATAVLVESESRDGKLFDDELRTWRSIFTRPDYDPFTVLNLLQAQVIIAIVVRAVKSKLAHNRIHRVLLEPLG